jgi:hypothetical protein
VAVRLHKVAVSKDRGQALEGVGLVDSAAREGDAIAVDIRPEYPDVRPRGRLSEGFGKDDREGVGLFSRRATGRPEPDLAPIATGLLDQLREDVLAQVVKELGVPEELGDLDQEAVDQAGVLLGIGLEQGRVGRERGV